MNLNKFMFASMILGGLSACSKDDVVSNDNGNGDSKGDAYMSLSIAMPNDGMRSRAINNGGATGESGQTEQGTDGEQKVSNLTVYVWSESQKLTYAHTYNANELKPTAPAPGGDKSTVYTTPAFVVKGGKSKVVAIVNGGNKFTIDKINGKDISIDKFREEMTLEATEIAGYATEGNFLMTNAFDIRSQNSDGSELNVTQDTKFDNKYNFDVDGTVKVDIKGSKQNPTTVIIPVERAVAKLEEKTTTTPITITYKAADGKDYTLEGNGAGSVTFKGIALVNANKSFYPIKKVRANGTNDYIVDPNFDKKDLSADKFYYHTFTKVQEKSDESISFKDFSNKDPFYTLENTMIKEEQKNAYTTGFYYKAQYDLTGKTPGDNVYRYQGGLYNWDDLQKVPGFPANAGLNKQSTIKECAEYGITLYENGICYYPYWIRHIPSDNNLDAMEFGVVRNNWYQMEVKHVREIGTNQPIDPSPETPDETTETQLEVVVKVLPWTVRKNNIDF